MTTISKNKVINELKKTLPQVRKYEGIADVLIAGKSINAIDESSRAKKWQFLERGNVTSNAFYRTCKHGLLDKQESARRTFVVSDRGIRLKDKKATFKALKHEQIGLLKHLATSSATRKLISDFLSLSTSNLRSINQKLKQGNSQDQLVIYSKVVEYLIKEKKYNKNYDYYWMGFRNIGDLYWLNESARRVLATAIA